MNAVAVANAGAAEIAHNKPSVLPQDIAAVSASLATGWLAPGPEVAALEAAYVRLHGGGDACAVSSGSAALLIALKGAGIEPGDRVAAPTYVCTAVLNAIAGCGASPILLDVEEDSFNVSPAHISDMNERPKAAIVVHTYGAAADVAGIAAHCGVVIEDCCQSLGGRTAGGEMLGRRGQASVCSFYATKIMTGGHGGMVYAANGGIAAFARDYVMFDGRDDWKPRFNFQMTDFQAALVRRQLDRLSEIVARRRKLAADYRAALPAGYGVQAGLDGPLAMPYRFVVRAPDAAARDRLHKHLGAAGIRCIVPLERKELLHRLLGLDPLRFPNAERIVATTLSVPLYPALTEGEAVRIVDALSKAPAP